MPAPASSSGEPARGPPQPRIREDKLNEIAFLVMPLLPLSIQAITVPVLSKAWKQWAEEQRAKERTLEALHREYFYPVRYFPDIYVPLWAALLQHARKDLSVLQQQRLQLTQGDAGVVAHFGVADAWPKFQRQLCDTAVRSGQLSALQWARTNGCDCNSRTCSAAAEGGHLDVLQWAHANGCALETDLICEWAAQNDDLVMLQWAHANGCDLNAWMCTHAAHSGHLAVLQWARTNGCAWDANTCQSAAWGGHLAVLQWARANGCDWDASTCSAAKNCGNLAELRRARANGRPKSRKEDAEPALLALTHTFVDAF